MFWFGRFAQIFIYPDNLALFGLIFTFVLWKKKRIKAALRVATISLILVIVPAIPLVSWSLLRSIERIYPTYPISRYPEAQAIVVLGGTVSRIAVPRFEPEETGGSRLLPAVRLYRAGKAKVIVVTGGDPYIAPDGSTRTQAHDMRTVLEDMGIPSKDIWIQPRSRNTEEDILFSSQLIKERGISKAFLVTNAFHMRRAMVLAQKTGIEWIPVPTGHEALDVPFTAWSFFPAWGNINDTNRVLKELIGFRYAQWRLARRDP